MINATKDYYVAGMSGDAIRAIYGNDLTDLIHTNKCCRPKEDVLFNDDQFFMASDYYLVEIKDGDTYTIYNIVSTIVRGLIVISKDQFDTYFRMEED